VSLTNQSTGQSILPIIASVEAVKKVPKQISGEMKKK
jgi:hypothetical protein